MCLELEIGMCQGPGGVGLEALCPSQVKHSPPHCKVHLVTMDPATHGPGASPAGELYSGRRDRQLL